MAEINEPVNSFYEHVPVTKGFVFHDGFVATNLMELLTKIKGMNKPLFEHYVNDSKNDFANWISHSLQNSGLASDLVRVTSQDGTIEVLEGYRKYCDKKVNGKENKVEDNKNREEKNKERITEKKKQEEIDRLFMPVNEIPLGEKAETKKAKKKIVEEEEETESSDAYKEGINTNLSEKKVREYAELLSEMKIEINKVFIGQEEVVDKIILSLMCNSHALLEGVPGLAKSLLIEVLARVVDGTKFRRIQFIPDMLPADVLGGEIYNPGTASFDVVKGPIFANFVLADEINRAPPKTHAALMEAMQERKISIGKEEFILDRPFLVLATENPLENKGTYALPEAVVDRFMMKLNLDYPQREHEKIVITENATTKRNIKKKIRYILTKDEFLTLQQDVEKVYISERIKEYILNIVEATRGKNKHIEGIRFVKYGAGPRASIYLGIASKARAVMQGRNYVLPEDIIYVAPDVLRHRVALNFKGKAHNISEDKIVEEIITKINAI